MRGFVRAGVFAALAGAVSPAWSYSLTLSTTSDHPGAVLGVSGSGFGANAAVDIYFDATDELLVLADGTGKFTRHNLAIPASALPGQHWISAVQRSGSQGTQKPFTVTAAWSEQGFGARGKRYNPYESLLAANNLNQLDIAWSDNMGGFVYGPPAVSGGVAYIGSCNNDLYALNAADGSVKWSVPAGTCPDFSSPAIAGGYVYIGSKDEKVYAFNAATGAPKWTFNIAVANAMSPVVANGVVYFGAGSNVYAVDAATGTQKWSAAMDGPADSAPSVANGTVFAASLGGTVFAFDAATGAPLWNTNIGGGALIEASPAVGDNLVYVVGNDGGLRAFRARDGVLAWTSATTGFDATSSPAVANGLVYCGNDGTYQLDAVDAQTGVLVWTSSSIGGTAKPISAPAVANGVVYIGAADGRLYALNAATGVKLWSGVVNLASTAGSPAVSDGVIYIGGSFTSPYDTYLTAFALNAGNNPAYAHRVSPPPAFAGLHPDPRLHPAE